MAKDMKILKRSEMDPNFCWNTADLYPDDQAWTAAFEAAKALPEEIAAYRGRLGESAETLYTYLCRLEEINRQVEQLFVYAFIRNDEDTANPVSYTHLLSGGNQQKVLVGRWLLAGCNILILDEPTRGVDVGAKYEIYRIMRQLVREGNSIIMVSSEMPELLGMSDRVMVMCEGRLSGILEGEQIGRAHV